MAKEIINDTMINRFVLFSITILVFSFNSETLYSQGDFNDDTINKLHFSKLEAISLVYDYSSNLYLNDDYTVKTFLDKFDTSASHANDFLLDPNRFSDVNFPIDEYLDELKASKEKHEFVEFDCEIIDVNVLNIDPDTSDFTTTIQVIVNKHIVFNSKQYKDVNGQGLIFDEVVPINFYAEISEDKYGLLVGKITSIELRKEDLQEFDYCIIKKDIKNFDQIRCLDDNASISDNAKYRLYRLKEKKNIVFHDSNGRYDDQKVSSSSVDKNYILKSPNVTNAKPKLSIWGEADFMIAPTSNTVADASESLTCNALYGEDYTLNFAFQKTLGGYLDMFVGAGLSNHRINLMSDEIYESSNTIDPDGFSYRRQATFSDLDEEITLNNRIVRFGVQTQDVLQFIPNIPLYVRGVVSRSFQNEVKFKSSSQSLFEGYYEDLYGVTIDDIYDFGQTTSFGDGDLNSLNNQLDFSLLLVSKVHIALPIGNSNNSDWMLKFHGGYTWRTLSFNPNESSYLEIDAQTLNSSTQFVNDIKSRFVNFGISVCYKQKPKFKDCN